METATAIVFWIGTACVLAGFGCAVAQNFVNESAKNVLNWITIGCTLVAFGCYVAYGVMK